MLPGLPAGLLPDPRRSRYRDFFPGHRQTRSRHAALIIPADHVPDSGDVDFGSGPDSWGSRSGDGPCMRRTRSAQFTLSGRSRRRPLCDSHSICHLGGILHGNDYRRFAFSRSHGRPYRGSRQSSKSPIPDSRPGMDWKWPALCVRLPSMWNRWYCSSKKIPNNLYIFVLDRPIFL